MSKLDENDYKRFTVTERLNLTIAALSRNDNEEVSRLRRTCQRKQYTMLDREYTSKLENLTWVSSKLSELHNFYYNQMILFSSSMATRDDKEELIKFHQAFTDQAICVKSLYMAFDTFCDEAELNNHHVRAWLKIDPEPIFDFIGEKTFAKIEHDNELTEYLKRRFLAIWNGDFN